MDREPYSQGEQDLLWREYWQRRRHLKALMGGRLTDEYYRMVNQQALQLMRKIAQGKIRE